MDKEEKNESVEKELHNKKNQNIETDAKIKSKQIEEDSNLTETEKDNETLNEANIEGAKKDVEVDTLSSPGNLTPTKENATRINKILIVIIIVLCLALVLLTIFIFKDTFNDNEKEENNNIAEENTNEEENNPSEPVNPEKQEPNIEYEENIGENMMAVYFDGIYCYTGKQKYESDKLVATIQTETQNAEVLDHMGPYANPVNLLYKDNNKIKIYDIETKMSAIISLSAEYDVYKFVYDIENYKIYGIGYFSRANGNEYYPGYEVSGYYNLINNKIMYKNKYDSYYYVGDGLIAAQNDISEDGIAKHYLLSNSSEKVLLNNTGYFNYSYELLKDKSDDKKEFIVFYRDNHFETGTRDIYTKTYKLIGTEVPYYGYGFDKDNNIDIITENKVSKYDKSGKSIFVTNEYDKVLHIIDGWYVVVINGKLNITNGTNVTKELGEWKEGYNYHPLISYYYSAENLPANSDKEAGIYMILETPNEQNAGVEYYFNINTYETKTYLLPEFGGYAKPVLYLYPTKTTDITVKFAHPENLTVTYPKFKSVWEVKANPNGDLYDKNGNYYYGLYWEEASNHYVDFSEGFYVTKDNAINFLEEKLNVIGLNARERNEFIMYWLPILEKNEKSIVYFELTEERESFNKLIINPIPDSLLRIAIHIKKVDKKVDIKEQQLPTFERKGFVAVEWGGITY